MPPAPARIRYDVRATAPLAHRAEVTLTVDGTGGRPFDLVVPSWVLGSYWVQDRVREISGVRLEPAEAPGRVTRTEKARWRVEAPGADLAQVTYSVYGNDLVTSLLDLNDEHLFLGAAFALPYVDGRRGEAVEVALHVPEGWSAYAELPLVGTEPPTFRAEDYDELIDSPIDVGRPTVLAVTASGIPHRIVLCGSGGNFDGVRLAEDVRKIAEATVRMFGESPVPSYTFFVHLIEQRMRGLEHRRSCACTVGPTSFQPEKSYREVLALLAHEYFHLYNVKRIRPAALVDAELTREVYTRLLWAMEGTTEHFGRLMLLRAGVVRPERYLSELAEFVQRYREVPGRNRQSLEDSSLVAWVDFYHPSEESPNRSISYYWRGRLASLALDLEIRAATGGARSLETVWRDLWQSHGRTLRGIGEDELEPLIEASAGTDLTRWFHDYVRGTTEIDLERHLAHAGLALTPKPRPRAPDEGPAPGDLRVVVENADGRVRLQYVVDGGPGRAAGLSPGDEVVAVNGDRVRFSQWSELLGRFPAGATAEFTVFRRHRLRTIPVTFDEGPAPEHSIVSAPDASKAARRVYESWLGVPWTPRPATEAPAAAP